MGLILDWLVQNPVSDNMIDACLPAWTAKFERPKDIHIQANRNRDLGWPFPSGATRFSYRHFRYPLARGVVLSNKIHFSL